MPNVLEPLIGEMTLVQNNKDHSAYLLIDKEGELSQVQFNSILQDLVTFLTYAAEPAQLIRYRLGLIVIAFLVIFLLAAVGLKKVYWRRLS